MFLGLIQVPCSEEVRVLKKTRKLISRGWCQDQLRYKPSFFSRTQRCLIGALVDASSKFDYKIKGLRYLEAVMPNQEAKNFIMSWNDAAGRTKEEVLEAIDKAIALAEAGVKV